MNLPKDFEEYLKKELSERVCQINLAEFLIKGAKNSFEWH